jgi:hypothetical protein
MTASSRATVEFPEGRILWTLNGVPIDTKKPALLGECCVLGCDKPAANGVSAFCAERHSAPVFVPAHDTQLEKMVDAYVDSLRDRCSALEQGLAELKARYERHQHGELHSLSGREAPKKIILDAPPKDDEK